MAGSGQPTATDDRAIEIKKRLEDRNMERPHLEVGFYQIVDDAMLRENRADGTGWEWGWADWQRDWMDATANRFAYRCLPLTIVNQTGWWVKNPIGFTATWTGRNDPGGIDFRFDVDGAFWKNWVNSQFGMGIITWNTPFLIRTMPQGSRLLVSGPTNFFKANAHPLTALIESDWMIMSFTMNWKIMIPDVPVRFDTTDPLFQIIPLVSNVCADLETASVSYRRLGDDPELTRSYNEWHHSRRNFHELKARGEVKPDEWQKDYFHGRDMSGREVAPDHRTKVKPPQIQNGAGLAKTATTTANGRVSQLQTSGRSMNQTQPRSAQNVAVAVAPASPRVDDEWRRWIAENLMVEASPQSIIEAMVASGISPQEADHETNLALKSPYVRGSELLRTRLKKRDWLLATYRKLNRMHARSGVIERRHKLSRGEFLADYYSTNRPVIITGMMDDWPAMSNWNLDYFVKNLGDREVEIQMGREAGDNYEIEREKYSAMMKFSEFIEKVRSADVTNDFYLTANNNFTNKEVMAELWDDIVQIPEYLNGQDRLSGFFWLGPPGTITPFHHDLTNNFMAQVIGRKRVKIAPSWDIPLMQNHFHCYSRIDGSVRAPAPNPPFQEPQILECILGPGEILFLPIGCMHFVEGIDISVTVSFINFLFDNDFTSFYSTYHAV
jgi:hypothetical protein